MAELFGEWLACVDGRAHYHLSGQALCGCTAKPSGALVHRDHASHGCPRFEVPLCRACDAANVARWAGDTTNCAQSGSHGRRLA